MEPKFPQILIPEYVYIIRRNPPPLPPEPIKPMYPLNKMPQKPQEPTKPYSIGSAFLILFYLLACEYF
jgi:hypothetical protein